MSEHYYSKTPNSKSNPTTWKFELRGNTFTFTTDRGVFSKNEVDFGSRTLIETFAEPDTDGDILDLGCGYGPIGLSLAKSFSERQFIMSDINERALELAEKNAKQNQVKNVILKNSDRLEAFGTGRFAAILTNPPIRAGKQTVHQMFEESFAALKSGGELWVVIQKKQGAPSALKKLKELFFQVETVEKRKGYFILKAKKQ